MTLRKIVSKAVAGTTGAYVGKPGEIFYNSDHGALSISDGTTVGGNPIHIHAESVIYNHNIVPSADNTYTLGTPDYRWKELYIGPGTLYITDQTLNSQAGLSVNNGVLLVNGANQLQVGQLKFLDNTIESTTSAIDIQIGSTSSTANLLLNRNVVVDASKTLTVGGNPVVTKTSNSFNPQFTDATGTVAGATVTGSYTVLDGLCFFRVYVDFSTCSNFGTGQYQITLPFPSIQTMRQAGGTLHQVTGDSRYHIAGITANSTSNTVHKFYYSGSTSDLAWKYNTPVGGTTTTSHFNISGWYQVA
jgi:hypothetical protein